MSSHQPAATQPPVLPFVTRAENSPKQGWHDAVRGDVSWHTLFSSGISPTDTMNAGIAILEPGETFRPHSHPQAEIYFMLEGSGTLHLDGVDRPARAGDAIFIPGNVRHGMHNDGSIPLRWFYVFATGSFAEVEYTFG